MTRDEAARAIGVAATEIRSAEDTEHGVAVVMSTGARRLIVAGDGFYATHDHPDNARLRRWSPPEGAGEDPEDLDPDQDPETPVGDDELVVPDGSVDQVTAWVGDNPDRAQAALEHERAKPSPRKSLIDRLEKL